MSSGIELGGGFWDRLGTDEGGLPVHLPMGVDQEGHGPVEPDLPHHYACWCGRDCELNQILRQSWTAGLGCSGGNA